MPDDTRAGTILVVGVFLAAFVLITFKAISCL